jgi:hypothetical protein
MTLAQLRLRLAGLWCGFWLVSCLTVIAAPLLRRDGKIGPEQIMGVLTQISGIWLPPLSCFVAFWFPAGERKISRRIKPTPEQIICSLVPTVVYQGIIFILLLIPLFFVDFQADARGDIARGQSLTERISEIINYALLLSPLVLAPVSYFTSGHSLTEPGTSPPRQRKSPARKGGRGDGRVGDRPSPPAPSPEAPPAAGS